MKKNIIILLIVILLIPFFIWFTESEYFDYILSLYPAGWKEKAIQFSAWTDYLATVIVGLIALRWLFMICNKNKDKNENKKDASNSDSAVAKPE